MYSQIRAWMGANAADQEFGFDSAEAVTFNSMVVQLPSFDQRTAAELEACGRNDPVPRNRERAIWELAYRPEAMQAPLMRSFLEGEPDPRVRSNLLWLARKVLPADAVGLLQGALEDAHPEVRDWAKMHLSEISGETFVSDYQRGVALSGTSFDQTVPLEIAGFAVVSIGDADLRVVLSPLWFAHIQGRVMACTRDETFKTRLTIEKLYEGFHPDGSDHYEIYPFAGKSWQSAELDMEHRYVTRTVRPFYRSGRVEEDPSSAVEVPMMAARAATTTARYLEVEERDEEGHVTGTGVRRVVSHVKGQYFGWAFASLDHFMTHGDILPGTVQLVSPLEPEVSDLVNCYICGTFRGKISDHNGDGLLDVNETICHGDEDGRLDYLGDRSFVEDPFA